MAGDLPQPVFENPAEERTESGYLKLSWEWPGEAGSAEFELQQSAGIDFSEPVILYRGPDYATFLSGLRNGTYYYRLRAHSKAEDGQVSEWTEPMKVEVKHHSLQLAFTLFGVGAVVFLLTVGIVVRGARMASAQNH